MDASSVSAKPFAIRYPRRVILRAVLRFLGRILMRLLTRITVTGSLINKAADISIISLDVRSLLNRHVNGLNQTETIDLINVPAGTYVLRIVSEGGVITKKVVIVH